MSLTVLLIFLFLVAVYKSYFNEGKSELRFLFYCVNTSAKAARGAGRLLFGGSIGFCTTTLDSGDNRSTPESVKQCWAAFCTYS